MNRRALAVALVCCALGLLWQWLTVNYNYAGNWTALFCHGSAVPLPRALAAEHIYIFPNSGGYDGQSYHLVAHDPFSRTEIGRAVPDPSLRFPRILLPALAHLLALGRTQWVDPAYHFCELFFLGLGAWWLARLLERQGRDPLWAALYVIVPTSIASIDRMLVDVGVVSLAIGFAFYLEQEETSFWKLYFVLMAAPLCRETGLLLLAAYGIRLLLRRRFGRLALLATAALPWALWTWWTRTYIAGGAVFGLEYLFYPFRGMLDAVEHPRHFAYPAAVVAVIVGLWWVQFAGILLALWHGVRRGISEDAINNACFLLSCFAILLPPGVYDDPFAGTRVLGPILLFQFLRKQYWPLLLVTPRVWLEIAPQAIGIVKGIVS